MPRKVLKPFLSLLVILLLVPWPVAFASSDTDATSIPVRIEASEPSAAPSWQAFGGAISGIDNPGDLFYLDVTRHATDILLTLYLTNAKDLVHGYRYLILEIGLYSWTDESGWQRALSRDGCPVPDAYLTLRNGQVSFLVAGYRKYKVTIDDGSFYAAHAGGGSSPQFYLEVTPV